ncbi:peptidase M23 [Parashewanella spongiae]|uniref:Peptidase M23 n=1 Tax=Parashewanella spongiae TaxID=342950 RepID=A0A3A6TZS7_9GAMM|nr:peptidoglycan DD-metalloendopeptidase family protein [Parashewanella spongiae]MCL1079593.1 peptidoglycan DD-metalloendopeptidase family protein [Parashewanella spongiae]RJY07267.1 peptidase M23 [Parashewanella spongiae]
MCDFVRRLLVLMFTFYLLPFSTSLAETLENRQTQLKIIQQQIDNKNSDLNQTRKQRQKLLVLLKQDDQAISDAAAKVNRSEKRIKDLSANLSTLADKHKKLEHLKDNQQRTLAKQLESAYLSGNHDYAKMLLNQQDASSIERLVTYYQYLNKARIKAIEQLKITLNELNDTEQELRVQQSELTEIVENQRQQANKLTKEKTQRQLTLTQLQRTLSSKSEQLEQLQIEEASLKQVIQQAIHEAKQYDQFAGLARQRGKLKWPTRGVLSEKFGDLRGGQVRWKGVLLTAPEGRNIQAIASGKIIYADWLKGFGLLIVVDHGKGYMSLYGHAQALLKTRGDQVSQGETLALVGRSGGQSKAGLYFEIRHKGKAVNPALYCKG